MTAYKKEEEEWKEEEAAAVLQEVGVGHNAGSSHCCGLTTMMMSPGPVVMNE